MRLAELGIRESEVAAVLDNNVRALLSNQGGPGELNKKTSSFLALGPTNPEAVAAARKLG